MDKDNMNNEEWRRTMQEWASEIRANQKKNLHENITHTFRQEQERKVANSLAAFARRKRHQIIIDDIKALISVSVRPRRST